MVETDGDWKICGSGERNVTIMSMEAAAAYGAQMRTARRAMRAAWQLAMANAVATIA